jgi:hypothetical protein
MLANKKVLSAALALLGLILLGSDVLAQTGKTIPPVPARNPELLYRPESLYTSLGDVINYGAYLFNDNGDYAGCYRLYQGALISVRPYLVANPNLLKDVDDALQKAEQQTKVADRAFTLRKSLDGVREKFAPAGKKKEELIPDPRKKEERIPDPKKVEVKPDEPKKDEVKKDEPKKTEPKKDDVKKDEPKKDEPKKDPTVPSVTIPVPTFPQVRSVSTELPTDRALLRRSQPLG